MLIAGLTLFPLGLRSSLVRQHCGRTRLYDAGYCQVGWAYMLAIIGTALAMFSPFLAQYTDVSLHERSHVARRDVDRTSAPVPPKLPDYSEVKQTQVPAFV